MARYRRLTLMEREEVSRMLAAGYSLRATGQALNRAPSTLSRELSRHHASPVTYRAVRAHQRARRWAHRPRKPRKLAVHPRLRTAVFALELRTLPAQLRRSLTYDHGQEMCEHRLFTEQTKIQVYFAHPHCPWERGTNENTNGLLRQFFPKGTRFNQLSRQHIKQVQAMFNDRPRKILNWHSPAHAFRQLLH